MAKSPLQLSNQISSKNLYDKIYSNLVNAGYDAYKDSDIDLSAYDKGDAIRDFEIRLKDNKLQFKDLLIDEKYQGQGHGGKIIDTVLKSLEPNYQVEVLNSINNPFWEHIASKYPNYKWSIK